ncbi:MAG: hypothetical protein AABX11_06330, partial [Nanoarchaeota archaeon]
NLEILSPEEVTFSNVDMSMLASSITQRMHQYDAVTKRMISERDFALDKLKEYAPHLFKAPEPQTQPSHPSAQVHHEPKKAETKPKKEEKKSKSSKKKSKKK